MKKRLDQLLDYFDRNKLQREVDEEFQFHIEAQARDYQEEGLTPLEAFTKARMRFGDTAQIKSECVQIVVQSNAGTLFMKVLFTIAFLMGVLIRSLSSELHVTRIGDVLIMIAIFGGLLLMCKRMRTGDFRPEREPLRLGLHSPRESMPLAFDEKGRTPFERVRGND